MRPPSSNSFNQNLTLSPKGSITKVSINTAEKKIYAPRKIFRKKVAKKPERLRSHDSLKMESARLAETEAQLMAETVRHSEAVTEAMWASLEAFNMLED